MATQAASLLRCQSEIHVEVCDLKGKPTSQDFDEVPSGLICG
jgi:hypothetical protein